MTPTPTEIRQRLQHTRKELRDLDETQITGDLDTELTRRRVRRSELISDLQTLEGLAEAASVQGREAGYAAVQARNLALNEQLARAELEAHSKAPASVAAITWHLAQLRSAIASLPDPAPFRAVFDAAGACAMPSPAQLQARLEVRHQYWTQTLAQFRGPLVVKADGNADEDDIEVDGGRAWRTTTV